MVDIVRSWAVFSDDRRYRYVLGRELPPPIFGPSDRRDATVCFVMLNPSVASESRSDTTLRRCLGYADTWGYRQLVIVNLFALVSTDPGALRHADDPVGVDNDRHLLEQARSAACVVCAWGDKSPSPGRAAHVLSLLRGAGIQPWHLALSQEGNPRHPLMLRADLEPVLLLEE